ncbi:MAG: metallopeptidase TldD-related protein [Acidobacteriota bacterium]|nr:metallopeptidase TldD-related protein [Acidobacteriota bacterium]MDH3521946.1 metallopeptidase TldD-related protein [Acidobacteriota bacterium]
MPFVDLETGGIARCLAQIADRPDDHVEAFFEVATQESARGVCGRMTSESRTEKGLAVRLVRGGESWLASSDGISPEIFGRAVARVARARPGAVAPSPRPLSAGDVDAASGEDLETFAVAVEAAIASRHASFPVHWDLRRHRRWSRTLGSLLAPEQQHESYYSCVARTSWTSWGTLLLALDAAAAESVAQSLTRSFRAQRAPAPPAGPIDVVLGPAAAAVFLHEAVAHALETDTLGLAGDPEAALGVRLAADGLDVVDNPAGAPAGVRRSVDDEGLPTVRRWLLRTGVVEQPLADLRAASRSERLVPGAARRSSRHLAPVPRSTHLELLPGAASNEHLMADCGAGLLVGELSRGSLDPLSGRVELHFPWARRLEGGRLAGLTGPGRLEGVVADLLGNLRGIGAEAAPGGAGWCAKGGHRLAVWASAPALWISGFGAGS